MCNPRPRDPPERTGAVKSHAGIVAYRVTRQSQVSVSYLARDGRDLSTHLSFCKFLGVSEVLYVFLNIWTTKLAE